MIPANAVEAAIDEVGELLEGQIGLRPEPTLRGRLRRCIQDEVGAHGDDLDAYVGALSPGSEALQSLVNRVTVQESGFFRHPDHFDVLANDVLPALGQPVTIWSAGCANGQEAYSLAMLLEERSIPGSVVATDLSTAALERTAAARYSGREVGGISPARRSRHLVHDGHEWQVGKPVRARVTTFRHNLLTGLPAHVGGCQVVFCRNVLIYFSAEHARAFLDRLAQALSPGAHLFLGSAESLWQVTDRFQAVRLGDSFAYRRREHVIRRSSTPDLPPRTSRTLPTAKRRSGATARPRPLLRPPDEQPPALPPTRLLAAAGQDAIAKGDHDAAVVAFRKWVYLAPDEPLAHLHLGLALEAGGHWVSARRAFGTARGVMLAVGMESAEADLEGYAADELLRLLDTKQGRPA